MKMFVIKKFGREIYRRKFWSRETEVSVYCFLCGFVVAMMIVIAM